MALNNWATWAIDLSGRLIDGRFKSRRSGIEVIFYKNWLYIMDEKGWRNEGCFIEPTIAELQHGELILYDVNIKAVRGPQEGIYAVIWSIGKSGIYDGMIGCSVYGFDGDMWIGVTKKAKKFLKDWLQGRRLMFDESEIERIVGEYRKVWMVMKDIERADGQKRLTPEEYEELLKELVVMEFDEAIVKLASRIDLEDNEKGFNQGESYISKALIND